YWMLGYCMLFEGRAAEALAKFDQAIRANPRNPQQWSRYFFKGRALIALGRYDEAVEWLNKAAASPPSAATAERRANLYGWIAAAQALANRLEEAQATAAEASRIWPMLTVRSFASEWWPDHGVPTAQIAPVLDGLRLAGIRDHADEDSNRGLESDAALHTNYRGPTPTSVPGARTIRTPDLAVLLERRRPLVLDTKGSGKSIPGTIALPGAGIGGAVSDEYQGRLKQKMDQLTRGERNVPIVTMDYNAERFEGRNLALRLAALGYTDVYWYRGGREAWDVAGFPQAEVASEDW
ncbi:MAG TPA: tetratricopeptide repeat protein, partial [Acetobacteraceae bacterium]|nr:tetratricopeptide repeat protein [Acetobacteraceae bacterium]